MKKVSNFALAAGLALVIAAPTGLAADRYEETSIRVSYKDLNIHSEAGAKVLYARLKKASEDACGSSVYRDTRSLKLMLEAKQCYEETLDSVVARIDSDELAKLHET